MKQTAVEWLIDQLTENGKYKFLLKEDVLAVEQAKAMEKEQIKEAWDDAYDKGTRDRIEKISNPVGNAEQYYNETYGK